MLRYRIKIGWTKAFKDDKMPSFHLGFYDPLDDLPLYRHYYGLLDMDGELYDDKEIVFDHVGL